jgi:hypothetical protein
MLFILVMDILNSLIKYASMKELLLPIAIHQARHRVSFYADDVVVFLRPHRIDLRTIRHVRTCVRS